MKRFALSLTILGLLALGANMTAAAELKVGDDAPEFTLKGSDGKDYKLSDFKGKQAVVIAWFPKAFTGGCTAECKSMRENGQAIKAFDVAYFTASTDTAEENTKFAKSLELDYPILSDPSKETAKAYGVLNEGRGLANRWTFYISKDGKIAAIDKEVKTMTHGKDIAGKLQDLGVMKR